MSLGKTQFISLVTKALTTVLGIAQTLIVVRLLTAEEFGLVGLVLSIGGVVGVSQHLGVVDGAIREIAVLKHKSEVAIAHWVSHFVRQIVTVPVSLALLLSAGWIAGDLYGRPELTLYLQIFALILILQGLQDVMGATLTGMKKFAALYVTQIITAVVNILAFGILVWQFGVAGFFWAILVTTSLMVVIFGWILAREFIGNLNLPSRLDIKKYGSAILRVSAYMYVARILFMVWQKLPFLVLGGILAGQELGWLNAGLGFGSRLTIIAMALSEVNLSWMSSLYVDQRDKFAAVATRNMQRVFVVLAAVTLVILFFGPDVLAVVRAEYEPARPIILVLAFAFFVYSLVDIGTSSVFVPADQPRWRAILYGSLTGITAIVLTSFIWIRPSALLAASAVLAGAVVAYVLTVVVAKWKFGVSLLTKSLLVVWILMLAALGWLFWEPGLNIRVAVFGLLSLYIAWEAFRAGLLPKRNRLAGPRIVCLAGAGFDTGWTNRQEVMKRVSRKYPVLYVEPRVWMGKQLKLDFWKKVFSYQKIKENIWIKSQWNLIPGSRELPLVGKLNHWLNKWNVWLTAWWLGFDFRDQDTLLWIYDTEGAEYLSCFQNSKVVYDCVDDHAAQVLSLENAKRIRKEEMAILKRADLVTVTSQALYQAKRDLNPNVKLVLNAGDVKLFQREESREAILPEWLREKEQPVIGSVGALDSYKVNLEWLVKLFEKRSDLRLVWLGRQVAEVGQDNKWLDRLGRLPNVNILAGIDRQQVPSYVQRFDVCIIPYRETKYNRSSWPLKFWEFMATGKPIVVSGVPELAGFRDVINYVESFEDFERQIESALKSPEFAKERRISMASGNDWDDRTERLLALVDHLLDDSKI